MKNIYILISVLLASFAFPAEAADSMPTKVIQSRKNALHRRLNNKLRTAHVIHTSTTSSFTIPADTFNFGVTSTDGFPVSGNLIVRTNISATRLSYTGISGNTFTGVTSTTTGVTVSAGAAVVLIADATKQ